MVYDTRIGVKERILDPTKGAAHPSGSVSLFYTIGFISGVCFTARNLPDLVFSSIFVMINQSTL